MCERNDTEGHLELPDCLDVGALQDLPAGTARRVTVGADSFTLVNLDGRVLAIGGDLCLCCGRPLSTATLRDGLLACGGCGWKYDVQRGCVEGLPKLRIELHDVAVRDGRLLLASTIASHHP